MSSESKPALFQPIKVGSMTLKHRVVLAPMTRMRVSKDGVPILPAMKEFYSQRASPPGTLLITEGTSIAKQAGGFPNFPGIWSDEQVDAWKEIVDSVHAKGSYIWLQVMAFGRGAIPDVLAADGLPYVSASDVPLPGSTVKPRPLTTQEISEYVKLFAAAASDGVNKAGFDGVEVHVCHGCLLDQFLQDVSNTRTDEYGGSAENRARFPLEVLEAIAKEIGAEKTAVRFSPWSNMGGMGMADPIPTHKSIISLINETLPALAWISVVEPRMAGADIIDGPTVFKHEQSNEPLRELWAPKPFMTAGGYTRDTAIVVAEKKGDLIAFGRIYLANPDLPKRLENNLPLNAYNRSTFYLPGDATGIGYTDYPFAT